MVKTLYEKTLSLLILFMLLFSVGIMAQDSETDNDPVDGDETFGQCSFCGGDVNSCDCYSNDCIPCFYECGACDVDCGGDCALTCPHGCGVHFCEGECEPDEEDDDELEEIPYSCPSCGDPDCYGGCEDDENEDGDCPNGEEDLGCGCGNSAPVNGNCEDCLENDGVDLDNIRNDVPNPDGDFNQSLERILETNSVIKDILSSFNNNNVEMVFRTADLGTPDPVTGSVTTANTDPWDPSGETFFITFNEYFIDENGWTLGTEALVNTLVHESIHAKHYHIFNEANRYTIGNEAAYDWVCDNYSDELANVFYTVNPNGTVTTNTPAEMVDKDHEHMTEFNKSTFDAAKEEHNNDEEQMNDCN